MRFITCGLVLVSLAALSAGNLAAATPAEVAGRLGWVSQACVRLPLAGKIIYTDPLNIRSAEAADLILITHSHDDHYSPSDIAKLGGKAKVFAPFSMFGATRLQPGQSATVDGLTITAVPAYNVTKTNYHPKSANFVGYLITGEGVTVYIAGDTERIPEMKKLKADIAIVPLGQVYTMNSVEDAMESVLDVQAAIAFPYHYGLYEGSAADADKFVALCKAKGIKAALLPKR